MRQIESEMLYAVCNRKNMSKSNTQVQVREDGSIWVRLHGNLIAHRGDSGLWQFTLAGWNTPTTRSRLRALGIDIRQRGGVCVRLALIFVSAEVFHTIKVRQ